MEVLLLYWDNLDDLAGAAALKLEVLRKVVLRLVLAISLAAGSVGLVLMAIAEPVCGLASATLLFVVLFYYRVTSPRLASRRA